MLNKSNISTHSLLQNELKADQTIQLFLLLANKIRFRILCLLTEGEFCVTEIVDIIQAGKISNISQQLKLLNANGIIQKRRESKRILYSINDEQIKSLITFLNEKYLPGDK